MAFEIKEEGFKLKHVLKVVGIPEATYHYNIKQLQKEDPDKKWKEKIYDIFHEHKGRYGYSCVYDELRNPGYIINHKKVQRIMNEMDLKCEIYQRKSRYKSHKGTVGKVAKNRLNRRLNTHIPLQKLETDVTEFKCIDEQKLYLSPMMDLYNNEVISYGISNRPSNLSKSQSKRSLINVRMQRIKHKYSNL